MCHHQITMSPYDHDIISPIQYHDITISLNHQITITIASIRSNIIVKVNVIDITLGQQNLYQSIKKIHASSTWNSNRHFIITPIFPSSLRLHTWSSLSRHDHDHEPDPDGDRNHDSFHVHAHAHDVFRAQHIFSSMIIIGGRSCMDSL